MPFLSSLFIWLLAALETLPGKILASLGIGWLTNHGYQTAVDNMVSSTIQHVNSISGVVYDVVSMAGFIDAFGIILGAVSAKATLLAADRFTRIISQ